MSRLSLRGRVTLVSAGVLALGLALLTFGVYVLLSRQLDRDVSSALRERAAAQLATLVVRHGRLAVNDAPNDEALDRQAWIYVGGNAFQRAAAPAADQRAADALAGVGGDTERAASAHLVLRAEPAFAGGGRRRIATVVVGVSRAPYEHTERLALGGMLAVDLFVLIAGALLVRRSMDKALRPVAEMTRSAADWSEHDLDRRFNLGPPRDELTGLSATLDALLARVASSLRHEQRFSAEMAHELRTPLSGVRGEAELTLRRSDLSEEVRESLEQVLRGTDRMEAVIKTLMTAARGDAGAAPGSADAGSAVWAALEGAAPIAEASGIAIDLAAPDGPLRVGVEQDLAVQALQPLLENAIRHAASSVRISGWANGDVVISVQDDGPGIPAGDREAIFEPGFSGNGGAGLGLPLARRLARSGGGDVTVVAADGGRFELHLPALPPGGPVASA